jgi:hypothetical protein
VRLGSFSLDEALSDGIDPSTSKRLARRAGKLCEPDMRNKAARGIERVVETADELPGPLTPTVPLNRKAIGELRPLLLSLADDLRTEDQVSPRGVAMIRMLLRDGYSPLYGSADPRGLEEELRRARVALLLDPRLGRQPEGEERVRLTTAAIRWSSLSVIWALTVGSASVAAGLASSSLALFGLGANSVLDGVASSFLVWRFRHERLGTAEVEAVERRAGLGVGVIMIAVALYLTGRSVSALVHQSSPEDSPAGIILAAGGAVVLPILAWAKLRLAVPLQSSALRGDGVLSLAGAVLAAATLLSLVLEASLGWWWSDPVAALLISAILVSEGRAIIVAHVAPLKETFP